MKLTTNFSRDEFSRSSTAERYHIDNTIPFALMTNVTRLAEWLQLLRNRLCAHYEREIYIIIGSGYRCAELNKKIKGSPKSAHMKGLAADITATTLTPYELAMFIKQHMNDSPVDQCILEFDQWVHVGLEDPDYMRHQYLEAYRDYDIFGNLKAKYKPLLSRERVRGAIA